MSSLPEIFRVNLRARMDELGLTYAEVGRRIGMDRSGVKQYLDGDRVPGLLLLERFSDAVEMSAPDLLRPIDEKISS